MQVRCSADAAAARLLPQPQPGAARASAASAPLTRCKQARYPAPWRRPWRLVPRRRRPRPLPLLHVRTGRRRVSGGAARVLQSAVCTAGNRSEQQGQPGRTWRLCYRRHAAAACAAAALRRCCGVRCALRRTRCAPLAAAARACLRPPRRLLRWLPRLRHNWWPVRGPGPPNAAADGLSGRREPKQGRPRGVGGWSSDDVKRRRGWLIDP